MECPMFEQGQPGKTNRDIKYECSKCQKECGRNSLHVKRVQFREMGPNGRVIKTRVTEWLCPDCLQADPDYKRPQWGAAPGLADTKIAVKSA